MGTTTSLQSLHSTVQPHSATTAHMRQGWNIDISVCYLSTFTAEMVLAIFAAIFYTNTERYAAAYDA